MDKNGSPLPLYKQHNYMFAAIRENNTKDIEWLLNNYEYDLGATMKFLRFVMERNKLELLTYFDVNLWCTDRRECPLHLATTYEAVTTLVKLGARLDVKCWGGRQPLHTADNYEVAVALIDCGVDIDVEDSNHRTPLAHFVKKWTYSDVFAFIEQFNPTITPRVLHDAGGKDPYWTYFTKTLPHRRECCLKVVLLLIWVNPFQERNISRKIAKLVWNTQKQNCW